MGKRIQFAALSLSGLLAGNELGTLIGLHPALRALPLRTEIESEQALTGHLMKVMPLYTSATMLAIGAAAVDRAGKPGFPATLAAAGATATMLAITGVGNIPLNRRTMSYPVDGDAQGWGDHPPALGTAPHRPSAARPDRVRLPGRRSTRRRPATRICVSPDSGTGLTRRLTAGHAGCRC